jgi:flagellar motor switch protein FliN
MDDSTPENVGQEAAAPPEDAVPGSPPLTGIEAELANLPPHARHLMQIRVPLQVKLASHRKSIREIVELGPGSIVKFAKTCDEPLELCIGDRAIAQGEVVKVGDKFGLKISNLVK